MAAEKSPSDIAIEYLKEKGKVALKSALQSTRHTLVGSIVLFLVLSIPVVSGFCAQVGANPFCNIYNEISPILKDVADVEQSVPNQLPDPPATIEETPIQASVQRTLDCTLLVSTLETPANVYALPTTDSDQLDQVQAGAEICYVKVLTGEVVDAVDQWLELDAGGFIHNVGFSPPS